MGTSPKLINSYLLHLGYNMWADREVPDAHSPYIVAKPYLRCDKSLWNDVLHRMVQIGMNLVVIDLGEGVKYDSHPELAVIDSWTPQELRAELVRIRQMGLEPIPKLNFSTCHDAWLGPYSRMVSTRAYYDVCKELIAEVTSLFDKPRFFHIGMDEENHRSYRHYVRAIKTLRAGLRQRKLRTVVWNDTALENSMWDQFAEKCLVAERQLPKDVVQVPWCYDRALPNVVKRLVGHGFDVWGAPGPTAERIQAWKRDILRLGGKGLLFTRWIPCIRKNRKELLNLIKTAGEVCG